METRRNANEITNDSTHLLRTLRSQPSAGFTLAELMIVLAVVAIFVSMAVPATDGWMSSQRLRSSVRGVASALSYARSETVRTGNIHLVFFGRDTAGDPLIGPDGREVDALVVDDGRPGVANCMVDPGEAVIGIQLEKNITWGTSNAAAKVTSDSGGGALASGSTFLDAAGDPASWVLFLPEGIPLAFDANCELGELGTGAGAVYLNDGAKDFAVVLTPLGARKTFAWSGPNGQWSS